MNFYDIMNDIVFSMVEGLIILYAFLYLNNKMYYFKEHLLKVAVSILAFTFTAFWIENIIPFSIHTIVYLLFIICLYSFFTKTNFFASVVSVLSIVVVYALAETLILIPIINISHITVKQINENHEMLMYAQLISKPFIFGLFLLISRFKIRTYLYRFNIFQKENHIIAYLLLIITLFVLAFVTIIEYTHDIVVATLVGLSGITVSLIGIYDFFDRLKTLQIESKYNLQKEYIKNMEKVIDAVRKEKHDYVNHLNTLIAMCALGAPDTLGKVSLYAKKLVNNDSAETTYTFYNTGNKYLDALLAVKSNKAKELGINFDVDFDSSLEGLDIGIDDIDLTAIIGNIVDNAFDAVSDNDMERGKIVSVYAYKDGGEYIISISNNGGEIPEHNRDRIFEQRFSTKAKTEGERGFGLYIAKQLILKSRAKIQLKSTEEETEFTVEFDCSAS